MKTKHILLLEPSVQHTVLRSVTNHLRRSVRRPNLQCELRCTQLYTTMCAYKLCTIITKLYTPAKNNVQTTFVLSARIVYSLATSLITNIGSFYGFFLAFIYKYFGVNGFLDFILHFILSKRSLGVQHYLYHVSVNASRSLFGFPHVLLTWISALATQRGILISFYTVYLSQFSFFVSFCQVGNRTNTACEI